MADDTNSEKKNKAPQVADMTRPGFATDGSKLIWRKPVLKMLPMEEDANSTKPNFFVEPDPYGTGPAS